MPECSFDHRLLLKKLKKGPIDLDPAVVITFVLTMNSAGSAVRPFGLVLNSAVMHDSI